MQTVNFITSLLTFYLKGNIGVDNLMLNLKKPNTIFDFIPLGYKSDQVPVHQISTAATEFKLNVKELVAGFIIFIISVIYFNENSFVDFLKGMVFLIVGIATILSAFKTTLTVSATSGMLYQVYFVIFERGKAEEAKKMILDAVVNRANDTNVRMAAEMQMAHSEQQTQAIVDAVNSLKSDKQ